MRAGRLRHRVTLQSFTTTYDEWNTPIQSWEDFATVWGAVEPLRGQERFLSQQRQASTDIRVVIRYLAGVTPEMRVKFGDRILAVKEIINPDERNKELHLMCEEGLKDG